MSELISGKEAKLAWVNGEDVECMLLNKWEKLGGSTPLSIFDRDEVKFRLKPRIITINGIEVPAPFEPKDGNKYFFIDPVNSNVGYSSDYYEDKNEHACQTQFGAWRTESEIKQVIEALRSIFK